MHELLAFRKSVLEQAPTDYTQLYYFSYIYTKSEQIIKTTLSALHAGDWFEMRPSISLAVRSPTATRSIRIHIEAASTHEKM